MYNASRTIIANKQQNRNYRPSGQIAPHVLRETQAIDSTEKVVEINGSYWAASEKFQGRYYRVVVEAGVWYCSATDSRVAAKCKAEVEAYIATLQPSTQEEGTQTVSIPSKSTPGVTHKMYIRNGKAVGCDCPEAQAVHIEKYNFKPCHHMEAWNQEEQVA